MCKYGFANVQIWLHQCANVQMCKYGFANMQMCKMWDAMLGFASLHFLYNAVCYIYY